MFGGNRWNNNNNWNARSFSTMYRCYSISMLSGNHRADVENGGKIIMPASALDQLTRNNAPYPMLFRLTNTSNNRFSHCGVLEFIAAEGQVNMPYWMMRNLNLEEGDMIRVSSATMQVATFSKFQPLSMEFLEVENPKTVLERALRNFACLTTGDVIALVYSSKTYEMKVLETRPGNQVSIIECDMTVDFEPPVGFHDPTRPTKPDGGSDDEDTKPQDPKRPLQRGRPDYNYQFGKLRFVRKIKPPPEVIDNNPFRGTGQTTKKRAGE